MTKYLFYFLYLHTSAATEARAPQVVLLVPPVVAVPAPLVVPAVVAGSNVAAEANANIIVVTWGNVIVEARANIIIVSEKYFQ